MSGEVEREVRRLEVEFGDGDEEEVDGEDRLRVDTSEGGLGGRRGRMEEV